MRGWSSWPGCCGPARDSSSSSSRRPSGHPSGSSTSIYFRRVLPLIGRAVSRHPTAYSYLPASVSTFPAPDALRERLALAGFRDCAYSLLTGGIAALHWGTR